MGPETPTTYPGPRPLKCSRFQLPLICHGWLIHNCICTSYHTKELKRCVHTSGPKGSWPGGGASALCGSHEVMYDSARAGLGTGIHPLTWITTRGDWEKYHSGIPNRLSNAVLVSYVSEQRVLRMLPPRTKWQAVQHLTPPQPQGPTQGLNFSSFYLYKEPLTENHKNCT